MIHVVTDSTSDFEPGAAEELRIAVVPLTVRFGEQEYRDGVDITADEFYLRLVSTSEPPKTSQPSPERFTAVYRRLLQTESDEIVSVHISSKLSGTAQSARIAAQEFGDRVQVVDTMTVSGGVQFAVREAAAMAVAGATAAEIVARLDALRDRAGLYVLVDTLTYLQRGGRIGKAQAFVGGILNVKPIVQLRDGEVHPESRVRSRTQGLDRLIELLEQAAPLERLAVFHSGGHELLAQIRPRLEAAFANLPVLVGQMGPVVGTYAGPGGLGVAFVRATAAD